MTAFSPPSAPSVTGTSKTVTPRVKRADFGDGYSQRAVDGLNTNRRTVTLSWEALASADPDTIENFMIARGGSDVITYTLPLESASLKWTNGAVKRTYLGGSRVNLSVDLTQEFDL